jgi:FkbH-like protein
MTDAVDLYWLPQTPPDFRDQVKLALDGDARPGAALRRLATHALDINQLGRLAKLVSQARRDGRDLKPLTPFRLGVVGNSTFGLIAPALVGSAIRHGIALEVIETAYDQAIQEALNPASSLASEKPDAVLVAIDIHGLPLNPCPGDLATAEATVQGAVSYVQTIRDGLAANTGATIIIQTVPRLPETLFGSFDMRLAGTARWMVDHFNRALVDQLAPSDLLLDVSGLAETVGLDRWHDPVQRNMAKLPFAQEMVPLFADHLGRLIGALRGKAKRSLVLDLDNTLWHGIIGDDGVEGIVIGQGDATGEAHLAVQNGALSLHGRGIVLAVSSKNNDDVARKPFREHPDMVLKEEHFAAFQANWTNKAANIRTIAEALSLGVESFAFLDDNPAERMQVRDELPEVGIPELPADPAWYLRTLCAAGYFEAIAFSEDDRKRAAFYQTNAERLNLQANAGDMGTYLRALKMTIVFSPFDEVGRARIAQLISKSNQFNLTTRRYSEAEVSALQVSPDHATLQVRLTDAFGDNGVISIVVLKKGGEAWEIDTWLMSCRVLGRQVEEAVLQEIMATAKAGGARSLIGRYIPTDRNAMVAEHYGKLGFELVESGADGGTVWLLPLDGPDRPAVPMTIQRGVTV